MKLTNILIASGLILLGATSVTAKQYPYLFVCQSCPRGTYGDGTTTSCTQCAAGTYSPGNATTCTKCRKGTSTNNQKGQGECTLCSGRTYTNAEGMATCSSCENGTKVNSDHTGCEQCKAGTYGPDGINCNPCTGPREYSYAGASSCSTCGGGTEVNSNHTGCSTCSAGYEGDGLRCTQCPAGKWSSSGSSSCTPCPAGQWSSAGASSCSSCSGPTYSDWSSEECGTITRTKTTYCGGTGNTSSTSSPSTTTETSTRSCSSGYTCGSDDQCYIICPTNSTRSGKNSCVCNAGYYMSSGSCITCPKGYRCPGDNEKYKCSGSSEYQDETGMSTCKTCISESKTVTMHCCGVTGNVTQRYSAWVLDDHTRCFKSCTESCQCPSSCGR